MASREEWMRETLRLARENVAAGGGPFGALVLREGVLVATGVNRVVPDGDPTAHAEVVAIRQACRRLGAFQLSGCELFASCEPCPMCAGAIGWARLDRIYYAGVREDAAAAGFDDALLWNDLARAPAIRTVPGERLLGEEGRAPFAAWAAKGDKARY